MKPHEKRYSPEHRRMLLFEGDLRGRRLFPGDELQSANDRWDWSRHKGYARWRNGRRERMARENVSGCVALKACEVLPSKGLV